MPVRKIALSTPKPTVAAARIGTVTLPVKRAEPPDELYAYRVFIYGEGGVGKSSLMSKFGQAGKEVMFFQFELANEGLELFRTPYLKDWQTALDYVKLLEQGGHQFGGVCIDTVLPAFECCKEHVSKRYGVLDPSSAGNPGQVWKEVKDEFHDFFNRLAGAGLAVGTVCHDRLTEMKTASGVNNYWRAEPRLSMSAADYFRQNASVVGYYHMYKRDRFLQIRPDDFVFAKANPTKHFLTKDGEQVYRIPMGHSAEEAYGNLIRAWENEQERTYADLSTSDMIEASAATRGKRHTKRSKT